MLESPGGSGVPSPASAFMVSKYHTWWCGGCFSIWGKRADSYVGASPGRRRSS
ncbi:hypothetical protein BC826DRAFT_1083841 [Russula brevipes]|nr:hypothetical protein BC826DRAFT_1083841 [Russula brevipes]